MRIRAVAVTACVLLLPSASMGQPRPAGLPPAPGLSTWILGDEGRSRAAGDPLETRVSVQFVNAKAGDILHTLSQAAGLKVELPPVPLLPVTITLTNVRLRVAFDAVCDTAACTWRFDGATVRVAAASLATTGLPPTVSLDLKEVAVPDVFRALGAALGVAVRIEGRVDRPPMTVKFTKASTNVVLDFICRPAGCTWEFDATARELRVRFNTP